MMKMRLLYITYKVDAQDSLVGHVVGWVGELASHLESIDVVCVASSETNLPENVRVHSLGKDLGGFRFSRWVRFFHTVWGLRKSVNVVFCQFSPQYVLAIAPLAKLCGWPIVFWYTHRHVGMYLRLATAMVDNVVSASLESFRLSSSKLCVIGHGIDTDLFKPDSSARVSPPVVLAVGRRAPIKNYELLIDAAARMYESIGSPAFRIRIVGGDEGNAPLDYTDQLQARIERVGLQRIVELVGPIPYSRVVREYRRASIHVNLCPTGGMDKSVLEGMACGIPTLVRNRSFSRLSETTRGVQITRGEDPLLLSQQLHNALNISQDEREQLGSDLRRAVEREHGLQQFVLRLVEKLREAM